MDVGLGVGGSDKGVFDDDVGDVMQQVRNGRRGGTGYVHGLLDGRFKVHVCRILERRSLGAIKPWVDEGPALEGQRLSHLRVRVQGRVRSVYRDMRRWCVMDHVARGEEAEAMKGGQRSITGARALDLSMTTKGNAGILLGGIEVIVLLIVVFLSVGVTLGEVLGEGTGRGRGGRGRMRT
jgi:hypothetical protein